MSQPHRYLLLSLTGIFIFYVQPRATVPPKLLNSFHCIPQFPKPSFKTHSRMTENPFFSIIGNPNPSIHLHCIALHFHFYAPSTQSTGPEQLSILTTTITMAIPIDTFLPIHNPFFRFSGKKAPRCTIQQLPNTIIAGEKKFITLQTSYANVSIVFPIFRHVFPFHASRPHAFDHSSFIPLTILLAHTPK